MFKTTKTKAVQENLNYFIFNSSIYSESYYIYIDNFNSKYIANGNI